MRLPLPSLSRSHHAVPRHQRAIAPFIAVAVKEALRRPLQSRSRCAIPCHQGAVAPSIAVAVDEPSRRPSPWRSRMPSIAVKEPLHQILPSRSRHPAGCHVSLLLTLLPPICRHLHLPSCRRRLLSPLSGLSSSWLRRRLSSRHRHIPAIIENSKRSCFMLI